MPTGQSASSRYRTLSTIPPPPINQLYWQYSEPRKLLRQHRHQMHPQLLFLREHRPSQRYLLVLSKLIPCLALKQSRRKCLPCHRQTSNNRQALSSRAYLTTPNFQCLPLSVLPIIDEHDLHFAGRATSNLGHCARHANPRQWRPALHFRGQPYHPIAPTQSLTFERFRIRQSTRWAGHPLIRDPARSDPAHSRLIPAMRRSVTINLYRT